MSLRGFVLMSVMAISFRAFGAPSILVKFTNGNQIYGSNLTIFSDGSITHGERTCCPPHTNPVPEPKLSTAQLSDLETLISQASTGQLLVQSGSATADGSLSGSLLAYSDGNPVIIYEVDRNAVVQPGSLNKVTSNQSSAATTLKNLVEAYVKYPLEP
jgi:hypothetical protein